MLRFLDAHWRFMEKVNGHAPFFGRKSLDNSDSFFPMWTAMLRFLYDFGIHHTSLTTGERQCSVFSSVFQRFRRYWTDMLRFLSCFKAVLRFKSGWIEPRLVGGYAPFSPYQAMRYCKVLQYHLPTWQVSAQCGEVCVWEGCWRDPNVISSPSTKQPQLQIGYLSSSWK